MKYKIVLARLSKRLFLQLVWKPTGYLIIVTNVTLLCTRTRISTYRKVSIKNAKGHKVISIYTYAWLQATDIKTWCVANKMSNFWRYLLALEPPSVDEEQKFFRCERVPVRYLNKLRRWISGQRSDELRASFVHKGNVGLKRVVAHFKCTVRPSTLL